MNTRLPLLILSVSALGACANMRGEPAELPMTSSAADVHRISVEQTAERLEVGVSEAVMSVETRAELRRFASGYLRYGHGSLILSAPAGGTNGPGGERVASEVRLALIDAGVSSAAVAASTYDATDRADAPVVVSFARFEAIAPQCAPLWQQDLAHQNDNRPWESFGCATQANLAAMVEDPQDLLQPRADAPRDNERRTQVFEAYREGQQTHALRSSDERVTVSNAAQ